MRADRLLAILLLLQNHRRLTARALAVRLEVSERTIHRDMEALCGAGIPLYAERGQGGGWRLGEEYRMQIPQLSPDELHALALAKPQRLLAELGLQQRAETALDKLLAALPQPARAAAASAWQRLHVDWRGWARVAEAVPHLPRLQEAVWQERQAVIGYRRGDGSAGERQVHPLGLVAKGSVWYLVAAAAGEIRTYRVARIEAARIMDAPCERPAGFDLAEYWERSSAEFRSRLPRYPLVLRADPAIVPRLRYAGWYSRVERVGEPEEDGWVLVEMTVELAEDACALVAGLGAAASVIAPEALRDEVMRHARDLLEHYARSEAGPRPASPPEIPELKSVHPDS